MSNVTDNVCTDFDLSELLSFADLPSTPNTFSESVLTDDNCTEGLTKDQSDLLIFK